MNIEICPNLCREGKICRQYGITRNEYTIFPLEYRESKLFKIINKIRSIRNKDAIIPREGIRRRRSKVLIEDCLKEKMIRAIRDNTTVWEEVYFTGKVSSESKAPSSSSK